MIVVLLVIAATAAWVGFDARKFDWQGSGLAKTPLEWVAGCLLLWIVIFPVYLLRRRQVPRRAGLVFAGGPERIAWAPPAPPSRSCPRCAETVDPRARVCRACGLTLTS
jgi:hypothetical protein